MNEILTDEFNEFDYPDEPDPILDLHLRIRQSRLFRHRCQAGYTQSQFAKKAGMGVWPYQLIERCKRLPTEEQKTLIANALLRTVDYLFPASYLYAIESGMLDKRDREVEDAQLTMLSEVNAKELPLVADGLDQIEKEADTIILREALNEVMETLTPREHEVLELRFGLNDGESRTYEKVGELLGFSKSWASQIEAKALRKIRYPTRSTKLRDFCEQ